MIAIRPKQRSDMEAAHVRANAAIHRVKSTESKKPWNVDVVLDLGNVVFFHFRGRAYGVPPLPWRQGQQMLTLWLEALSYPSPLTKETTPKYYRVISQLSHLLWRNCYPANPILRTMRWFWLLRNPFATASEVEIAEHANFFLSRRMRSGVFNRQTSVNALAGTV